MNSKKIESIIDDEKARAGPESNLKRFSSEHVQIVLRGHVDDISFKVPRLLATQCLPDLHKQAKTGQGDQNLSAVDGTARSRILGMGFILVWLACWFVSE